MITWILWRSPDYFWILDSGVFRFRSWCSLSWGVLVAVVSLDCSCGILIYIENTFCWPGPMYYGDLFVLPPSDLLLWECDLCNAMCIWVSGKTSSKRTFSWALPNYLSPQFGQVGWQLHGEKKGPTNLGKGTPPPPLFRQCPRENVFFTMSSLSMIWEHIFLINLEFKHLILTFVLLLVSFQLFDCVLGCDHKTNNLWKMIYRSGRNSLEYLWK